MTQVLAGSRDGLWAATAMFDHLCSRTLRGFVVVGVFCVCVFLLEGFFVCLVVGWLLMLKLLPSHPSELHGAQLQRRQIFSDICSPFKT